MPKKTCHVDLTLMFGVTPKDYITAMLAVSCWLRPFTEPIPKNLCKYLAFSHLHTYEPQVYNYRTSPLKAVFNT